MKIRYIAASLFPFLFAACGGSGGGGSPADAPTSASAPAAPPASTAVTSNGVTAPSVTNTLTQGPGLVWNQGTVNSAATVPGIGMETVTPPPQGSIQTPAWSGSALYLMGSFTGTYTGSTLTTLAGTLGYLMSTDGETWQAQAVTIPNTVGAGYVMYPQSLASDGKGTLAVFGLVVPSNTSWGNGVSQPLLNSTYNAFVAYANTSTMRWSATMLPVSSANGANAIKYAYGNWWVTYAPNVGGSSTQNVVLKSSDLTHWSATNAPGINFQPAFTQGHPYWVVSGGTPSYSDDLSTWVSVPPHSSDGTVRYFGGMADSNANVMLMTNVERISTTSNQEIDSGNVIESTDGVHWIGGGFSTFTGQPNAFACSTRLFSYGNTQADGIFLSDDGLNWTQAKLPKLTNNGGAYDDYSVGGCLPTANRAFMFTVDGKVVYSN